MARTKQRLINFHTSGKTTMPSSAETALGEIVVRHNNEKPELLILLNNNKFATFEASGAVQTKIDNAVQTIDSTISTISSVTSTFMETVAETYETKTNVESKINNVTSAYTKAIDTAIKDFSANTVSALTVVDQKITLLDSNLSGQIDSLSANSATKEELSGVSASVITAYTDAIAIAKGEAIEAVSGYANSTLTAFKQVNDEKLSTIEENISALTENSATKAEVSAVSASIITAYTDAIAIAKGEALGEASGYTDSVLVPVNQNIADLNSNLSTLSGSVSALSDNLTEIINNKVTTAYRYKGSCAYADLPTSGEVIGEVWNVTDANGNFPAGTNYAWTGEEWDALGGSIDLSPYATNAVLNAFKQENNNKLSTIEGNISSLSANSATKAELTTLSGSVISDYTKAIATAKDEAIGDASGYTDRKLAAFKQVNDGKLSTIEGNISSLSANSATKAELTTLSGSVISDYTKAIATAKDEAISAATGYTNSALVPVNQNIADLNSDLSTLSSSTVDLKAAAIQSVLVEDSATTKVKIEKVGTELKFNFSEIVIDCGEF